MLANAGAAAAKSTTRKLLDSSCIGSVNAYEECHNLQCKDGTNNCYGLNPTYCCPQDYSCQLFHMPVTSTTPDMWQCLPTAPAAAPATAPAPAPSGTHGKP